MNQEKLTIPEQLQNLKVGDEVTRLLGGIIPMKLKVTEITDELIVCGAWTFSKKNGAEIDTDLGWSGEIVDGVTQSGSYLKLT